LGKLRIKAGLDEPIDDMNEDTIDITFEDLIFLRVGYEYSKASKKERNPEFNEMLDDLKPSFDDYQTIFEYLLKNYPLEPVKYIGKDNKEQEGLTPSRLIFSEWMKFSLQLSIEDEVTRRNLVSLMF